MDKHRYDFPRFCTNTWSYGGCGECVMLWVAGMTREEFEEYRAFVMLTLRVAERTVLAETIQPPFPEHPVEVQDPKGEV